MGYEAITGLFLFGILVGTAGTLIGLGGGFLLIPLFLIIYRDKNPAVLTAISLAVICTNSISGSIAYARMKRIAYRAGLIFSAAALPGVVAGAILVAYFPMKAFELILGFVIIAAGIYLFLSVKKRINPNLADAQKMPACNIRAGIAISLCVGLISSILGIGGGIVHVPMMIYLLDFPVHLATATSHFMLAIMTGAATIVHIYKGNLNGQWTIIISLSAGVVIGAQAGAFISQRFSSVWIIRLLAASLIFVGLRIIYQGL